LNFRLNNYRLVLALAVARHLYELSVAPPVWIVPFDSSGDITEDATVHRLIPHLCALAEDATDIYIACHGLHGTPAVSAAAYLSFFQSYDKAVTTAWSSNTSASASASTSAPRYKPLYIGMYWPSVFLADTWRLKVENNPSNVVPSEDPFTSAGLAAEDVHALGISLGITSPVDLQLLQHLVFDKSGSIRV
jgi:hypothetical protein